MASKLSKQLRQNNFLMGEKIMNIGMDYLPYEKARIKKEKRREFIDRIFVLCGLCIVNIATFPSLYSVIWGSGYPPPASFTGLLFVGLSFYLCYSLRKRLYLYALGEFIGICANGYLCLYALSIGV
tara:strand:+ start:28 stop:405 length:378 start_codon:yes stop_codon:yes gene_type:complete